MTDRKINIFQISIYFILILFSFSIFNLGGYILSALIAVYFFFNISSVCFNKSTIVIFLFSVSYFCFYGTVSELNVRSVLIYVILPWASYLFGFVILSCSENKRTELIALMISLSVGFFMHALINTIYTYRKYGLDNKYRISLDIWQDETTSVTGLGLLLCFIVSISIGALFIKTNIPVKISAAVLMVLCGLISIYYENRTIIIILGVVFVFNIISAIFRKEEHKINLKSVVLLTLIAGLLILLYSKMSNEIAQSDVWIRMKSISDDGRFKLYKDFFDQFIFYPFGGKKIVFSNNQEWVHNLWLDIYNSGGVIPFLLFLGFTVNFAVKYIKFVFSDKSEENRTVKILLNSLFIGTLLNFAVEPVFDANPYILFAALMVIGAFEAFKTEEKKIEQNSIHI